MARQRRAACASCFVSFAVSIVLVSPSGAEGVRLGTSVVPVFQFLELDVDPAQATYSGATRITIEVNARVPNIRLNAQDVEIDRALLVLGEAETPLRIATPEPGVLQLEAGRPIDPGKYDLSIEFRNEFNTQAVALYRVEQEGDAYAFTQFEAVEARKTFPCWDEPSFKIPFQLALTVPRDLEALANTFPERTDEIADGERKRVLFHATKKLPSYLVAMAVGPLERVEVPGLGIPGAIYTPKGRTRLAALAAEVTPRVLGALEEYFGTPYPFEKLDQVAVPEFWAGAMENAGLITYRDEILLLDSQHAPEPARRHMTEVITHEIAHQWFGNLVTMEWWDDLWLNEAFADWIATKVCNELFPEDGYAIHGIGDGYRAITTDSQLSARAIRGPIKSLENLLESADVLVYEKGEKVLGMFERWTGEDAFRETVRRHLAGHAWGNATAADLWTALSGASQQDVAAAMATYLDQPGVPLVEVTDLGGGRVEFRQRRFLTYGADAAAAGNPLWHIPIVYRYDDGSRVRTDRLFLTSEREVVSLPTREPLRLLHPNVDEAGYYVWNVQGALRAALNGDELATLDIRERVGFAELTNALFQGGELTGSELLTRVRLQSHDQNPRVVSAAAHSIGFVHEVFIAGEPGLDEAFAAYVASVLTPLVDRYGLEPKEGEDEEVTLLRPDLLGSLARHTRDPAMIAFARAKARAYLDDPDAVEPSLAGAVLHIAARHGDAALFEELLGRFRSADVPGLRRQFLSSLGVFEDPALARRALDLVTTEELRPQEILAIPFTMFEASARREDVWPWLEAHYDALRERMAPPHLIYLAWFGAGCSQSHAERTKAFFELPEHVTPGMAQQLKEMSESVASCVRLREKEGESVAEYLRSFDSPSRGASAASGSPGGATSR